MKSSRKIITRPRRQLYFGIALLTATLAFASHYHHSTAATTAEEKQFHVMATLAPLHSLVAGVMQGVGEPDLLLKAGDTPHHFALKPQDAEAMAKASLIFAVSLPHEYYLKPLHGQKVVEMAQSAGVTRLPPQDADEDEKAAGYDLHLWLDPENAIAFTYAIADALEKADPSHKEIYENNKNKQIINLENLNKNIKNELPIQSIAGYVTFHPTLQYFEHRFGIRGGKALAHVPEAGASVAEAEALYAAAPDLRCVLLEQEFNSRLLEQVAAKYPNIRKQTIDPLGWEFTPSPALYGQMLESLAGAIAPCLK